MATITKEELVLRVEEANPENFDVRKYDAFLDILYGRQEREYQRTAVITTLNYLRGKHNSLKELARKNFEDPACLALREQYPRFEDFEAHLQIPDKLACSIDHATGTGKSYLMYGIAMIMLAEGVVAQVLVLGPTTTIEDGVRAKFEAMAERKDLAEALSAASANVTRPRIIDGTESIRPGDICIENVHTVYRNSQSGVRPSLVGRGAQTLVLNDETHHLYSVVKEGGKVSDDGEWKKFLLDPEFGFQYIVGFSGTCYIGNDYFTDVIDRYSLDQAVREGFIKNPKYRVEIEGGPKRTGDKALDEEASFDLSWQRHQQFKSTYGEWVPKPLTLMVTRDITTAKDLAGVLRKFLRAKEGITAEESEAKVLLVTSELKGVVTKKEKEEAQKLLATVDDPNNPVEWIISVSMLSEGWDVKNVFHIIPHEKRAFESKLLIAQVVGRGLRRPEKIPPHITPILTIANHHKWAYIIEELVNDVLEVDQELVSYVGGIEKNPDYNFTLHNVAYRVLPNKPNTAPRRQAPSEKAPLKQPEWGLTWPTTINFTSQVEAKDVTESYQDVKDKKRTKIEETYQERMTPAKDVAEEIVKDWRIRAEERGEDVVDDAYVKTRGAIEKLIVRSLKDKAGEEKAQLNEANRQKAKRAFQPVQKARGTQPQRAVILEAEENLTTVETRDLTSTVKKSWLIDGQGQGKRAVYMDGYTFEAEDAMSEVLKGIERDGKVSTGAWQQLGKGRLKTPTNIVLASSKPEKQFIVRLTSETGRCLVDAWIKSDDRSFYSIDYVLTRADGSHPQRKKFNPDFFLLVGSDVVVVETKEDSAKDPQHGEFRKNQCKCEYAKRHFEHLNELLGDEAGKRQYHFTFLTPDDYQAFFDAVERLKDGKGWHFNSILQDSLEERARGT